MTTPHIRVRPAGATWCLHITYADGTTHVPAYYDTRSTARQGQGVLQRRYATAPPDASVQDLVRLATRERSHGMPHDDIVEAVLAALDTMTQPVTDWEARFLESLLRQTFPPRPKQLAVLVDMAEQYLDPRLAAELRGQLRLFA